MNRTWLVLTLLFTGMALTACAPTATPTPAPTAKPSPPAPTSTSAPAPPTPTRPPAPTATAMIMPPASATPTTAVAPTQTPVAANTPPPIPKATAKIQTPAVSTDVIARGLVVPWAVDFASDGRIFVSERQGRIRIIKDGQLQAEPWLTLDVAAVGEGGLLGLALDPDFARNKYVYVAYTYSAADRLLNRLARLREDTSGNGVLDKILLDAVPGNSTHDGGRVRFGPDGKLYWTMGDAQQQPAAQNASALNGKILRLNADGSIPADNPFAGSPVFAYGLRNPQGLAWQPHSDRLYATDHGPSGGQNCCRDEVNHIEAGKNYGWPEITGDQTRQGMEPPVIHSGDWATWAPSGATFVSGGPWNGSLLVAGLRGLTLYRIVLDENDPRRVTGVENVFANQFGRLRDVAQGPDGAIYLLTSNRDGRGQPTADDDRLVRVTIR